MGKPFESSTGTYTGTAAVVTVTLGYRPQFIKIWNETDGDAVWEAIDGLADDDAYQILDTGAGTTDVSLLAANGITISDSGFSVGTGISEAAKVFRYFAIGGN